jgi:hypothetical protein
VSIVDTSFQAINVIVNEVAANAKADRVAVRL